MRAGDIVKHGPSGEEWVVAYDDGQYLAWCGWPPGEALTMDCTLVKSCSDAEHVDYLRRIAEIKGDRAPDLRASRAKRALDLWNETHRP